MQRSIVKIDAFLHPAAVIADRIFINLTKPQPALRNAVPYGIRPRFFSGSAGLGLTKILCSVVEGRKKRRQDTAALLGLLLLLPSFLAAETVVLDGMEWERVNPLIATRTNAALGSTYTLSAAQFSPFTLSELGSSHVSGWLNDSGLTSSPSLIRTWAATAWDSTFLQFDIRPDSGDYGKWGFYLQNSSAKLASLFMRNGQFQVRGRTASGGSSTYIPVPNITVTPGQWYHVNIVVRPPASSNRSYSVSIKDSAGHSGALPTIYYDVDTTAALTQFSIWPNGISAASIHLDNVLITKVGDPEFRYGYFPSQNLIRFYVVSPATFTDWTVSLRPKGSTSALATQSGKLPFFNSANEMTIPVLVDGDYEVTLALSNPVTGRTSNIVRTFTQKTPPWRDNQLGTNSVVLPPFTPLALDIGQSTVSCLLRTYKVGRTGLWDQVTTQGQSLLAGPMQLQATMGGVSYNAAGSQVNYSKINGAEVVGTTRWNAGNAAGDVQVDYEYDGMMKVTLRIEPTTAPISDLSLVIPLQDSAMTNDPRGLLMHAVTDGLRKNPVGRVPAGVGVVWNSANIDRNESVGPFVPYIWLGGPERGLCWFGDSDKDWIVDDTKPELEVKRSSSQTSLIVHFINQTSAIERKRTIVFGLMATPAKPMPDHPSFRKWSFGPSGAAGNYPFVLLPTAMGRGALSRYSSFYPAFKNYSLYSELAATRRTGLSGGSAFVDSWIGQPQFGSGEFTAEWKGQYRTTLGQALYDLSHEARDNYVLRPLVRDGMEGERVNAMSVSTPEGSSYASTTDDPSPFVSGEFGQSTQSGLLVNRSTTNRPVLGRDHFGASGADWVNVQFDFKPVSGRSDQWGFWVGRTETNTYAASLKIKDNAFWVYGRATRGGAYVGLPVPNIAVSPGSWYHIDFLINPTTSSTEEKAFSVRVTDASNRSGVIPQLYFITDFSAGVNRILFTGIDDNFQAGAIQLDNIVVSEVKPTAALIYINPSGMTWGDEVQTYLDEWSSFDVADPRWDFAVENGYRWLRENSGNYNALTSLDYRAQPVKSYTDMLLYYSRKMLSSFAEGVYFDNLYMTPDYNSSAGSGYTDEQGRVHAGFGIFALRDLYKRLATMQYEMGMQPLICSHMTNAQLVPVLSFATMNYDLEWYGPGLSPGVGGRIDFQDRFGLDSDTALLLAGSTGLQSGNPTFLVNYLYDPDPKNPALHQHLLRTVLAACLVHEIRLPAADMGPVVQLLQLFRYGEKDAQVYHYWDTSTPITTSGAPVKTLVVSRPNQVLVVVGSFGPGGTSTITLDLAKMKLASRVQAIDYETGAPLVRLAPGVFIVPIEKHDFKMVLIR